MRITSVLGVWKRTHTHIKEKFARQTVYSRRKKKRFDLNLYCLVGFVLVSIKDATKLLKNNKQGRESDLAVGDQNHLHSGSQTNKHK